MGIFNKFRKKKAIYEKNRLRELVLSLEDPSYLDIISVSLGVAYLNQENFKNTVLNNLEWHANMRKRMIMFGDRHYPIQFVGSESNESQTWKWSWDNVNDFPESLFQEVAVLKDKFPHIVEFNNATLNLSARVKGIFLAAVSSAILEEKNMMFLCPFDTGSAYILIQRMDADVFKRATSTMIESAVMDIIAEHDLNHYLLIKGIFLNHGIMSVESESVLRAKLVDGVVLEAVFDDMKRLITLKAV